MSKRLTIPLGLVTVLALGGGGALWWFGVGRTSRLPPIDFYGLVVDETGAPVDGAEIQVRVVVADPTVQGGLGRAKSKVITRRSGADGRFSILDERGLHMWIADVRKGDLQWLVDRADIYIFQATKPIVGNQFFLYHESVGPVYVPDPERPAVFSLFPKGTTVAGRIIRGGADRYPDGRLVQNEPRVPILPSVGPDAPKTGPEEEARLTALVKSLRDGTFSSEPTASEATSKP